MTDTSTFTPSGVAEDACAEFRRALARFIDQPPDSDLDLVDHTTFIAHAAACPSCQKGLLEVQRHIQAHRVLGADGRLDADTVASLERSIPLEFALLSEQVVRKRARELGRLKFQILRVYLKMIQSEHVFPRVLDAVALRAAEQASQALVDRLERYKESNLIFADGGMVNLRSILEPSVDARHEGQDVQLRQVARGLLTARTLDPSLDEYVLHHLGALLEQLGHYEEAVKVFLDLASLKPTVRTNLRAQALNSAGCTSFRYLGHFKLALEYLQEAAALYPNRWTIEYNLATYYLWPGNPDVNPARGAAYFGACRAHAAKPEQLENLIARDAPARNLLELYGLIPASESKKPDLR